MGLGLCGLRPSADKIPLLVSVVLIKAFVDAVTGSALSMADAALGLGGFLDLDIVVGLEAGLNVVLSLNAALSLEVALNLDTISDLGVVASLGVFVDFDAELSASILLGLAGSPSISEAADGYETIVLRAVA